jgi:hypothetical protein
VFFKINNRDIRKVRKRQHQYPEFGPEFGHTQGEIFKKTLQKNTLAFNRGRNSENHQF